MTTWGDLFERASDRETTVEAIRERLDDRRSERAATDGDPE